MSPKDSAKSVNPYAGQAFPANPEYKGLAYQSNPDNFDRAVRPTAGAPKTVKVPDTYRFSLANGIKAIGTTFEETPFVHINIKMEGGELVHQDLKKIGLAELTANMLEESTKNYTPEQIEAELDKLGSSIFIYADKTNTTISVRALKRNLDPTLKVLEEKLFNPAFKEEDLKRIKKQTKADIKQQERQPDVMAGKAFDYVLYGETLFGTPTSVKSVEKITLQDIKDYYDKFYTPSLSKVTIVGGLNEQEAKQKLEILNRWTAKNVTLPTPPAPQPQQGEQFFIYDISGASSSVISMGYTSIKFEPYGDFFKNKVANFIFGGNFNSRLNLNLREDKGYTYGIYSGFSGDNYSGEFTISSSVKRKATALSLAEISKELKEYNVNGITDKELEFTKNSLLNQEAIKYESAYQKLNFLTNILTYNLESDYAAKQNGILKNITKDEVNTQIKKYITNDKINTVIVGDKVAIEAQLKKYNMDNIKLKKVTLD
ncbi:MAG: insulinase family protein [Bacteroidetes bacterium]|nr:MAG: insulinase family protein [Bacteroidota bacterium]